MFFMSMRNDEIGDFTLFYVFFFYKIQITYEPKLFRVRAYTSKWGNTHMDES